MTNKANDNYIVFDHVSYSYQGILALREITFSINQGECVALMGPNGCGKTTLLKLMNALIVPEKGSFSFLGDVIDEAFVKDKKKAFSFHQRIGYVFQNSDVQLFNSNVFDEIAFGPRQMRLLDEEVEMRTNDCMEMLEIAHLKERAPYQLSGGEKKKVALASVLSMNPDVIVFDEPLAALDSKSKAFLLNLLKDLKQAGKTLVISTHDETLARELADRVILMNDEHEIASIR